MTVEEQRILFDDFQFLCGVLQCLRSETSKELLREMLQTLRLITEVENGTT